MMIQASNLLILLATVVYADGGLLRPLASVSPAANDTIVKIQDVYPPLRRTSLFSTTNDDIASTEEPHLPIGRPPSPTTNDATANKQDAQSPLRGTLPFSTRNDATATTENPHALIRTSPSTTNYAITSTEEPHPPIHGSFFTTDGITNSSILMLPRNETDSRLLFWPPSAGINVTLKITVSEGTSSTFEVGTALPQHWHSIDIYQPIEGLRSTSQLYLHTELRYINLNYLRVIQMQVSSEHPTYWCYCPRAHLCTLLSPLEYGGDPGERTDLLAALMVVVFLLIVTLLALGGVTFYRRDELFHIYAKPVDCLPYAPPPPPLPTPNKQPPLRVNRSKETKQIEDEKVAAKTDRTEDTEYSKVGGEGPDNVAPPTPPPKPTYDPIFTQQKKHESINNLYGLI